MSKSERRIWSGVAIFLFVTIVVGLTIVNANISTVSQKTDQKADLKYVNYTVLSKYDSIMTTIQDVKNLIKIKK
jgi:hypothetical protein